MSLVCWELIIARIAKPKRSTLEVSGYCLFMFVFSRQLQSFRRRHNNKTTVGQCLVLAGYTIEVNVSQSLTRQTAMYIQASQLIYIYMLSPTEKTQHINAELA